MTYIKILSFTTLLVVCACGFHTVDQNPAPLSGSSDYTQDSGTDVSSLPWYVRFDDPALSSLIEQAFARNFSVQAGLARLDAARAISRQSQADFLPSVNAEVNSRDGRERGSSQEGVTQAGTAFDWEIDAFGRLRALNTADDYETRARAEDVEALRLSLSADIAEAYYGAIAQARQLALLEEQERLDSKFLDLVTLRFEEGIGTRVDVLQQQSQLSATQVLLPRAEADRRVFENRLDVLLGAAPDGQDLTNKTQNFPADDVLPRAGVPSDLLLNRPDLRALQNRLVAQDAEIGAAIADRLPRITLSGSYLYGDGPGANGPVGSVLGSLAAPLLDWGKRRAAVAENKALYQEQLYDFTQAYLEAIEDVENALYQENRQREYLSRLNERRAILQDTVTQAEAVYTQGLSDYLPVLSAIASLRDVEQNLIFEEYQLALYRIRLHRALGGFIPKHPSSEDLLR